MLSIKPSMRISAHDALAHPWFAGPITEMPQGGELLESLSWLAESEFLFR
jgi:hypothetical protein